MQSTCPSSIWMAFSENPAVIAQCGPCSDQQSKMFFSEGTESGNYLVSLSDAGRQDREDLVTKCQANERASDKAEVTLSGQTERFLFGRNLVFEMNTLKTMTSSAFALLNQPSAIIVSHSYKDNKAFNSKPGYQTMIHGLNLKWSFTARVTSARVSSVPTRYIKHSFLMTQ